MKPGVYIQPDGRLVHIVKINSSIIQYLWDCSPSWGPNPYTAYGPFVVLDDPLPNWYKYIVPQLEYLGRL